MEVVQVEVVEAAPVVVGSTGIEETVTSTTTGGDGDGGAVLQGQEESISVLTEEKAQENPEGKKSKGKKSRSRRKKSIAEGEKQPSKSQQDKGDVANETNDSRKTEPSNQGRSASEAKKRSRPRRQVVQNSAGDSAAQVEKKGEITVKPFPLPRRQHGPVGFQSSRSRTAVQEERKGEVTGKPFPHPRRQYGGSVGFKTYRSRTSYVPPRMMPFRARRVWFSRSGMPKKPKAAEDEITVQVADMKLTEVPMCDRFEEMGLNANILKGICSYGLEKPAYIQQQAIMAAVDEKHPDIIVQAQSGMGKTAALAITILQRIEPEVKKCQALIVVPTRELALQVTKVFEELSSHIEPKLSIYCCAGGNDRQKCAEALVSGQQIVIGTVGRTLDMMMTRRVGTALRLDALKVFALDEADQLLEGNWTKDLSMMIERLPPPSQTQVILMSATISEKNIELASRFMLNPLKILVRNGQLTLDGIKQFYVKVNEVDKFSTLADLYGVIENARGMIFCNTKKTAEFVAEKLRELGHPIEIIASHLEKEKRDQVMEKFRRGEEGHRVVITSDILGRGIDIQQINLVINYDVPSKKEAYIHRVGRAGRYGRKGIALTFVTEEEDKDFHLLEEFYETEIQAMPTRGDFESLLTGTTA